MLGALFGLSLADAVLTRFIISQGIGFEANPWIRSLASTDSLILIKALGTLLAVALLWLLYKRRPRLVQGVTVGAVCYYTLIVFWNVLVVCIGAAHPIIT
jgi:Domain of unknown function (DUF5658)